MSTRIFRSQLLDVKVSYPNFVQFLNFKILESFVEALVPPVETAARKLPTRFDQQIKARVKKVRIGRQSESFEKRVRK